MSTQQEDGGKTGAPDSKATDGGVAPPKEARVQLKLKRIASYVMLAFAPTVAIAALVVAVVAVTGNKSAQEQLGKATAKIDGLNASLSSSKAELDKLKLAMLKEKALQNEEFAKQDERMTKVIQNITPLQVKLKIAPTLEEQLRQPANAISAAPAVVPHVSSAVVAPVVAAPHVSSAAPAPHRAPGMAATPDKHRASGAVVAPAKTTETTAADKNLSPQVKAMKEAIELYNKKK